MMALRLFLSFSSKLGVYMTKSVPHRLTHFSHFLNVVIKQNIIKTGTVSAPRKSAVNPTTSNLHSESDQHSIGISTFYCLKLLLAINSLT